MTRSEPIRTRAAAKVVDLNAVRLRSLRSALRVLVSEIVRDALDGWPTWFAADDCAQWAFTHGQLYVALQHVLADASPLGDRSLPSDRSAKAMEAYRSMRSTLADILRWCDERAQEEAGASSARALALASVSERILVCSTAPIAVRASQRRRVAALGLCIVADDRPRLRTRITTLNMSELASLFFLIRWRTRANECPRGGRPRPARQARRHHGRSHDQRDPANDRGGSRGG